MISKLHCQLCSVATEQLSLFQAVGFRSDIRAQKTMGPAISISLYIESLSLLFWDQCRNIPPWTFLLQRSKSIPSFLNMLTDSSFPLPDKSHHWHQCQAFVSNPVCRYPMYKFILLLFINTASATPYEHKKLVSV